MILAARSGIAEARAALPVIEARIPHRPLPSETEVAAYMTGQYPVEAEYYPMPHVLLSNDKAASRNFFSPCRGPSPKVLPPRWDKQMEGLPGLSSGRKLFENGDYLAAVDDWVFPAIYGRYEASDVITMLYMTDRLPGANKCLGAIWSQHGGKHQPRMAAYLAQAFAAGWGVRQNPEKAYL